MNSGNPLGVLEFPIGSVVFNIPDGIYKNKSSYKIGLLDDIIVENGKNTNAFKAKGNFKWGQNNLNNEVANGTYFLIKSFQFSPRFQKSNKSTKVPSNIIDEDVCVGTNEDAQKEMDSLGINFSYAKPSSLITYLSKIPFWEDKDITILDFFAGSGTTLHATMELNKDGGHRKCILVTNNENGICENVTYERNKRVIQGYTTPKGEQVAGLTDNNLRYYRTDFVGRSRSVQNMRRLVNLSTDMLCIKEDLYEEQREFAGQQTYKSVFRYFDNGRKRMLVIYREEAVEQLARLIAQTDFNEKIKVYVFSPSEDPWEETFEEVADKVELCALPAAIYNAYRRVLPKQHDEIIGAGETEQEPQTDGMLNFTD